MDFLPIYKSKHDNQADLSMEECVFLGRMIGDGYWNKKHFGILFNKKEKDVGEEMLFNLGIEFTRCERGNIYEYSLRGRSYWKSRLGLVDYVQGRKVLPRVLLEMSSEQLLGVFKGWVDADGYKGKDGTQHLISANKELIFDLQALLSSHGIRSSINVSQIVFDGNAEGEGRRDRTTKSYTTTHPRNIRRLHKLYSQHSIN